MQYAHIFIVFTQNVKTEEKKEGKEMGKEKEKRTWQFYAANK